MARLYADENFDLAVVVELRALGHDVLTAQEAGQAGQRISDRQILAFAISESRAVVTFDRRDFVRLHGKAQPHDGVVVCTRDSDSVALASRIDQKVARLPTLDNQLILVIRPSSP